MTVRVAEVPKYNLTITNNGKTVSVTGGKTVTVKTTGYINQVRPITTVTADYTALDSDYTILCDCTNGNITLTLNAFKGRIFKVKKIDSTTNQVILDPAGSATIDGELTQSIVLQWECLEVQCDAAGDYYVL